MQLRQRLLMDKKWRFHLGDIPMNDCRHVWSKVRTASNGPVSRDYDDSAWREIDLPHDFVVEGNFSKESKTVNDICPLPMTDTEAISTASHGYLPVTVGWYRKRFAAPELNQGRRAYLVFDGIYRDATLWLNGLYLDRHQSGYTECRIDVTDMLMETNILAVRVDPRQSEGWFYEGGGIYRHVWMEIVPSVAVAPHGTFVWTRKLTANKDGVLAELEVRTKIQNDTDARVVRSVICEICDAQGRAQARLEDPVAIPSGAQKEIVRSVAIENPRVWSLEDPHLYTIQTHLTMDGVNRDCTETPFGIRTTMFHPEQGFFLNGEHVKIKGVCVHQNHAGVGTAIPDSLFEHRIRQLQKLGCNAYRSAHYPHAPELLNVCDRLGMLVMDETRSFSSGPEFMRQHESMLLRDRNHPSIFIYAMANEEGIQNTPVGEQMMQSIRRLAKRLDPSRPVTTANNEGEFWGTAVSRHIDVQGCNYCPEEYDRFHREYPEMPMIATETSSRVTTRGIYRHDPERGYVNAYNREECDFFNGRMAAEAMWRGIATRPFIAGAFVWTGIDYKGESGPYHWPTVASHFGMLDSCCFPKDLSYFFKTWWTGAPDMHLFPHWNWQEGDEIDVWCYARYDYVELFLNGESLGRKKMPEMGHVSWLVPYAPGTIEARGFSGFGLEAKRTIETTGSPAAIRLETEFSAIRANGEDVAVVNSAIVDEAGRIVPTACNSVEFDLDGKARIIGVGNGDPSSHEPDRASKRKAFNGLCQVLVQSTEIAGDIRVCAHSPGLESGELVLSSHECVVRPRI